MASQANQPSNTPAPSARRWQTLAAALLSVGESRPIRYAISAVLLGAIAVLSLVPGEYRPHSYIISDGYEHTSAYALTAFVLAGLAPKHLYPYRLCVALMAYAGILELVQAWVPGRTASVEDFIAGAIGGALGVLLAAILRPRLLRTLSSELNVPSHTTADDTERT